ncbi:hypothetical protein H7K33_01080 [Mycobacterium paraense]|uniref:hypothetical protein n=1 Tax=Mycobacterium paraense TaxID=767916 RepID=UPI000A1579B2|nr:hypothetical protein [Mycobacterium paraense]MCV7440814.1 hypothetical protein [Mycobacterium paraense]
MDQKRNPWEVPGWRAIGREAALINQLLGSGATALGRANYADRLGDYYTAFFGLSIGLERLAKLILIADRAISDGGALPNQGVVRKFGHKLAALTDAADKVCATRQLELRYKRPASPIVDKIIDCLDAFADAGRGRYANFKELGDPSVGQGEPIEAWWNEVADAILAAHYYGKPSQKRIESNAEAVHELMTPVSFILFINESNDVMMSAREASLRTGQSELVQRYGRYYALTVARWLAEAFSALATRACFEDGIDAFFGVWEHLSSYVVPNELLKSRKVWPLS